MEDLNRLHLLAATKPAGQAGSRHPRHPPPFLDL
jgi:hypothetical protein